MYMFSRVYVFKKYIYVIYIVAVYVYHDLCYVCVYNTCHI